MKQGPELSEIVLKGCACDEQTICGLVGLQLANKAAVEIFDTMPFILEKPLAGPAFTTMSLNATYNDDKLPPEPSKKLPIIHADLIARHHHGKAVTARPPHLLLSDRRPISLASMITDDRNVRRPFANLVDPVRRRAQRRRDQERSERALFPQKCQKGNCLNRLAQAHLVGQDPVQAVLV